MPRKCGFLLLLFKVSDTLDCCSAILYKGDNFCAFLFAFLNTKPNGSTLKGKNLLPLSFRIALLFFFIVVFFLVLTLYDNIDIHVI